VNVVFVDLASNDFGDLLVLDGADGFLYDCC
jgi:hypothetical protein